MLYTQKKESYIPYISKRAGVNFIRIGPPQPMDIAKSAAEGACEAVQKVSEVRGSAHLCCRMHAHRVSSRVFLLSLHSDASVVVGRIL